MTKGEYRVGVTFNPSNDSLVAKIKRAAADLIDLVDDIGSSDGANSGSEVQRLKALAQTHIEDAAMWAGSESVSNCMQYRKNVKKP